MSISVVIPCYNGSKYITEALESVFAQTQLAEEIIVVDDASNDGTPELVERIAEESPVPLRVVRLDENSGGPARPMNVGINASKSEFVLVLDQDDVLMSNQLDKLSAVLLENSDLPLVFSWCGRLTEKDRTEQSQVLMESVVSSGDKIGNAIHIEPHKAVELLHTFDGGLVVGFPAMMFRKSIWKQKGEFCESLRIAVDYDFLLWVAARYDIAVVPHVGYWRRRHQTNLCNQQAAVCHELALAKAHFFLDRRGRRFAAETRRNTGDAVRTAAWFERQSGRYRSCFSLLFSALFWCGSRHKSAMAIVKTFMAPFVDVVKTDRVSQGERSAPASSVNGK